MRILILEDEIPAYQKLQKHLEQLMTASFTQDWARSIEEGKTYLASQTYDLILSDIQLLDGLSFDLFSQVEVSCPIIFCSAFDNYLFQAFETNGIAYVLKPYSLDDLKKAIEKYQALFEAQKPPKIDSELLQALKSSLSIESMEYKKRFVIKRKNGIQLLSVNEISLIEASGDFCLVTDKSGKRHPISQTLGALHEQLSPVQFFRINRSQIVQLDAIQQIENHFKNRLLLSLQGVKEKPMTSTANTAAFRKWLEA